MNDEFEKMEKCEYFDKGVLTSFTTACRITYKFINQLFLPSQFNEFIVHRL